jgi:sugar lactone lactonase YvrE
MVKKFFIFSLILILAGCKSPTEEQVVVLDELNNTKTEIIASKETALEDQEKTKKIPQINIFTSKKRILNKYFKKPMGIAINTEGQIYIIDQDKNKLYKMSQEGDLLDIIGITGSFSGEFKEPKYMIYNDNKLYIADTWNHRIQVMNDEGKIIKIITASFFGPKGMTVYNNKLYVADTGNHTIKIFDKEFKQTDAIGTSGKGKGEFNEPTGLTSDDKGNIYVVDSRNNRIVTFNEKKEVVNSWTVPGWPDNDQGKESFITYHKGKLYMTDHLLNKVRVFTTGGKELEPLFKDIPAPSGIDIYEETAYVVTFGDFNVLTKKLS